MPSPARRLSLAFVLALAAGCQRSSPTPEVEPEKPLAEPPSIVEAPKAERSLLVWVRDTTDEPSTFRIDEEGHVLERVDGIRIAIEGVEWRWQEERITARTEAGEDCGSLDEGEAESESFVTRASLSRVDDGSAQTIVAPPPPNDEASDYEHVVELVRSAGPLLFVRQSTYVYGCGAHGNLGAQAFVWDASRNTEVELATEIEKLEELRLQATRILSESDDAMPTEEDEVGLAELLPRFDAEGGFELALRFTGFACYACSDEDWSSYTKSVFLPAPALPEALAPHTELPAGVRAFLQEHPELELGGVSVLDASSAGPEVFMAP